MPRALTVGNGRLHINLDEEWRLRDVYFPHVGLESHAGSPSRLGFWCDGAFAWLEDFERRIAYEPDTMVGVCVAEHRGLGLGVEVEVAVDYDCDVLVRTVRVADRGGADREVRVFVHTDLDISGTDVGDTAFFDPDLGALVHYKGMRYFLVSGAVADAEGRDAGIATFTAGRAGFQGFAGSWADAEDGELSGHAIEQGAVDSCVGFAVAVPAHGTASLHTWLCAGTAYQQVADLDALVRSVGPGRLIERTRGYWRAWTGGVSARVDVLPERLRRLYARSLLVSRQLCDCDGGVLAATDRDILAHARDTYCYVWPRDGALVAGALARAGHGHPLRRFLRFCAARFGRSRGYLLHKFTPDGALGSSWHPWWGPDGPQVPIQQDETALVLWTLGQYDARDHDREFLSELYRRMVVPAADWMAAWRDPLTRLPNPSWDLWEERRGVHAFTVAAVHGGLLAAAAIARDLGEVEPALAWAQAAAEVRVAADEHLLDAATGRFARSLVPRAGGSGYDRDMSVDASLYGLVAFGMHDADEPAVVTTMEAVHETLWVRGGIGGVARYERDYYHWVDHGEGVPGNPWIICTLWLADWLCRRARSVDELDGAVLPLLDWVADRASATGLLPEQVHPYTGAPLSVQPLTWSHAAYVDACIAYAERRDRLAGQAIGVEGGAAAALRADVAEPVSR